MNQEIQFSYKNYKGEISQRRVLPAKVEFGLAPGQSQAEWLLWGTDLEKKETRAFVLNHIVSFSHAALPAAKKLDRHFCVTVYIFDPEKKHTLLLHHKKLNKWIPPGGHLDANELPEEAALREVFEETGLRVELMAEKPSFEGSMLRPEGVQLNPIVSGEHEHMDFVFQAIAPYQASLNLNENESLGLKWFSVEEIVLGTVDTFPSIKYWLRRMTKES